jgi:hypothetical protein
VVHQAIEDRRAHGVVPQICPPVLHDAIRCDDDAAAQFVALMDQGLQQCAGVVGDGACEEQIVQHQEIAVDDGSQSDLALRRGVQGVAVEEVVGLKILDLVALQDRLIGNRLGDVGFPGARFADEQRVLAGGNESPSRSWFGRRGVVSARFPGIPCPAVRSGTS